MQKLEFTYRFSIDEYYNAFYFAFKDNDYFLFLKSICFAPFLFAGLELLNVTNLFDLPFFILLIPGLTPLFLHLLIKNGVKKNHALNAPNEVTYIITEHSLTQLTPQKNETIYYSDMKYYRISNDLIFFRLANKSLPSVPIIGRTEAEVAYILKSVPEKNTSLF